ncbi:hypothetical protein SAICODRAFT_152786 [Saitoella complicata NRRL Y-17804]|uniref:uncharacterized protein n=1 Tax=Saitoella complicata (strain BCRC 22490 / CBS 7301 / JCM 7358 / NBRC 10748 / NRRL Y-17804) TaxID=698492 RepID=UPI000867CE1F|nr:uncharacterized protein SAICODRAFT_152786 [Saitoella complicata NRRL Y-17804]ODQ55854.1 hypothetical protein SAICODRAFT_152786 [Saitoella complicata NRRL Y-17804]
MKLRFKVYYPTERYSILFLLTCVVEALCVLALSGYVFGTMLSKTHNPGDHDNDGDDGEKTSVNTAQLRVIPVYLAIFIFAFVYQLGMAWDALRLKSIMQTLGLALFNVLLLAYSCVQINQVDDAWTSAYKDNLTVYNTTTPGSSQKAHDLYQHSLRPELIAVPIIIGVATCLNLFCSWKLYSVELRRRIWYDVGASTHLKRLLFIYQVLLTLLKFDFFFLIGFLIQELVVVDIKVYEEVLSALGIAVTLVIIILCAWALRHEKWWPMVVSEFFFTCGLAYFSYKLYRAATQGKYKYVRKTLIMFASISLVMILITIIIAGICLHNFGKGLKRVLLDPKLGKDDRPGVIKMTQGTGQGVTAAGSDEPKESATASQTELDGQQTHRIMIE